jgi:phosphoglycolate phosphatase
VTPFLIAFDLDGTLVDSARDLADSVNELLESFGAPALRNAEVLGMVGEGAKVLVARAMRASRLDPERPNALARFKEIYDLRLLNHTRAYDGIVEVLEAAAPRAAMAVLTNKPEAPARRLLDALDLGRYFRWVIGGDGAFPRKPDPAALRYLVAEAGADLSRSLYVGDSNVDIDTARRAGVPVCLARYGFGYLRGESGLDDADWTIEAPLDLLAVIDAAVTKGPARSSR